MQNFGPKIQFFGQKSFFLKMVQIRDQTKTLFDSLISSLLSIATSITWPKIQGIRRTKGNLGRYDALKASFGVEESAIG